MYPLPMKLRSTATVVTEIEWILREEHKRRGKFFCSCFQKMKGLTITIKRSSPEIRNITKFPSHFAYFSSHSPSHPIYFSSYSRLILPTCCPTFFLSHPAYLSSHFLFVSSRLLVVTFFSSHPAYLSSLSFRLIPPTCRHTFFLSRLLFNFSVPSRPTSHVKNTAKNQIKID